MNREDEIKAEQLAIAAHQRRLDELLSDVWPKKGDRYWNTLFPETYSRWDNVTVEQNWLSLGLLHRTQEDAQAHHDLLKVVQELRECDGFRPFVVGRQNYCFYYNTKRDAVESDHWAELELGWEHLYYETKEQRDAALSKVGYDRMHKAMKWAAGRVR